MHTPGPLPHHVSGGRAGPDVMKVGELVLPLTGCSALEKEIPALMRHCTLPGQPSRADHVDKGGDGHGTCDCGKCKCDAGWSGEACQYPTKCDLTKKISNQMCKNSQDVICSNAGTCHCGRCKCDNSDGNGLIYGKFCECDDRECIDDETEEVCGGHGKCYCGNCYCEAGWHGDKCEFQCDITPWESKRRCTSPDGKICSNRGTCVCGECSCHDVDPTGDWGDIHGDTCECDERDCRAVYDRYSDDFCSGHGQCNCGRCDCRAGWYGKNCEHPRSCLLSAEESTRKCQSGSELPCSGRGNGICSCGNCECWDGWNGNACEIWLGTEYP
ncbi:Itgbl1 [Phodopus roborovskii]|uniref:Itgbl1 protein n=1 Tax=Phodopus roborovskii TaxID=109678 RepID=A0AAU9ZQV6_PHORO|nr:Itgbl1 [Phodopus roborovskii]